jgi:hypothetical protein
VNGNGNCGSDREVISRENIRKYREKAWSESLREIYCDNVHTSVPPQGFRCAANFCKKLYTLFARV